MRKTIVVLGSWGRDASCYTELYKIAPKDWSIQFIPQEYVAPKGNTKDAEERIRQFFIDNHITSATLVGHSIGGSFVLAFASANPSYIEQLILVNSLGIKTLKNLLHGLFAVSYEQNRNVFLAKNLETIFRIVIRPTIKVFLHPITNIRLIQHARQTDWVDRLADFHIPTTIIWGEKDKLLPPFLAKELHSKIKGSKLVLLKEHGHEWLLHQPALLIAEI